MNLSFQSENKNFTKKKAGLNPFDAKNAKKREKPFVNPTKKQLNH